MRKLSKLFIATNLTLGFAFAAAPIIDNQNVRIWDVKSAPAPAVSPDLDHLLVYVTGGRVTDDGKLTTRRPDQVEYRSAGVPVDQPTGSNPPRFIMIEFKKSSGIGEAKNTSGLPNAFPRTGVKQVLDRSLFTVWSYRWLKDQPTPMHFHNKDAIAIYMGTGAIKSTTQDGKSVVSNYTPGVVKYNLRDRIHTEELAGGEVHAIIVELK